ncbi:glycosyltransferase family protein [Lutibaculum baratangense]|uniref:Glycosyl transferase family 28 C-terminal domain-containing protein n=1 Tax=Lutibaculum baratangense AMV1 TaxID=631454 RepID=V4RK69_9HYPH|nr:glycosyltransferase [Lutibaculum baratangense]ESR25729.1 hypothetical protein N177_1562 [Lutibaculum baratangense AMV1]
MKALIYVQHLLGSGQAVRMAGLAAALSEAGVETVLATGSRLPPFARDGTYEVVELPFARARNALASAVVDDRGTVIDDRWRSRRRARLLHLFEDIRPDLLVIEGWPFGQRHFDFELNDLVAAARQREAPPLVVCALADAVPFAGDGSVEAGIIERIRNGIDLVLVNGDPRFLPFKASFDAAGEIEDGLLYTGYVHLGEDAPSTAGPDGAGEILVSCGSGAVGDLLLTTALKARPLSGARDLRWRLLIGNDMDDLMLSRLASEAPPGVVVERARRDFPNLLKRARLSVSQAGYNTVADLLASGCPGVLVPFARGGETEQTLRAAALARAGAAIAVEEFNLSPSRLAAAVDTALTLERHDLGVKLDGLRESVRQLLARAPGEGWSAA